MTKDPAVLVLRKELDSVIESISDISRSLKQAREMKKSLEHALEVLGELLPLPGARRSRNGKPALADCTIRILQEKEALSLDEIVSQLAESGREVGKPSVTTVLSRLKKNKAVRKRDDGRWCLTEASDDGDPKSDIV